jgi:hypothetical protein
MLLAGTGWPSNPCGDDVGRVQKMIIRQLADRTSVGRARFWPSVSR